jgi:hypothetical protein
MHMLYVQQRLWVKRPGQQACRSGQSGPERFRGVGKLLVVRRWAAPAASVPLTGLAWGQRLFVEAVAALCQERAGTDEGVEGCAGCGGRQ